MGDELCCGVADAVDVDGKDTGRGGWDGDGLLGELHAADIELYAFLLREVAEPFVVVDEDECLLSLIPVAPPQVRVIALLDVLLAGIGGCHGRQHFAVVLHEEVQLAEHVEVRVALSEFVQRCLEVVGHGGQVVPVGAQCALLLVQCYSQLALGVRAAVVHIVAQQVAVAAQLDDSHRVGIFWIDVDAAVVRGHHAAPQLAGEVGVGLRCALRLRIVNLLGGDGSRGARLAEIERLVVLAASLLQAAVPEPVGIVAIERQHLAVWNRLPESGPAGEGVEWQFESDAVCHLLELHQVGAVAAPFIVELSSDDGSSVFPLQALHLREYLAVESLDVSEKHLVHRARLAAREHDPVGYAAAAYLAVAVGADAQHDGHPLRLASLQEAAQVPLSAPVILPLNLLDVVPEDIAGQHGDAALLHLLQGPLPFLGRYARIVDFSHGRHDSPSVYDKALLVPSHLRLHESCHAERHYKQYFFHISRLFCTNLQNFLHSSFSALLFFVSLHW